jgi:hypothetical protein
MPGRRGAYDIVELGRARGFELAEQVKFDNPGACHESTLACPKTQSNLLAQNLKWQ